MSEISKHVEKAEKLFQRGRHAEALEEYLAILREEPSNDKIRQQAADLCVSLNRTEQAAELLGPLFDRQVVIGDGAKAIITYKRLARLTAPSMERSFRFAQLIERSSRKEALEAYEAAFAGFITSGRKAEAMTVLERIVALDTSVANLQRQGDLANELGDRKAASQSYYRAGEMELKGGGDGLEKFERAHQFDPANLEACIAYTRALFGRGDAPKVISILQPVVVGAGGGRPDIRDLYGRALLAAKRPVDAEPYVWELFQRDARQLGELAALIGQLVDAGENGRAIALSRKAEAHELKAGRRREYVLAIREVAERRQPGIEFLEYLTELYNNASREQDYCSALSRLFDLYYAAGNFLKAADSLDRAAEVDPYESGHAQRLEMLRGKIDPNTFSTIARRFAMVGAAEEASPVRKSEGDKQPTMLEDFMLQAEIFLQYSMRSKAVERLERVSKLFPFEEEKNERLRALYVASGFSPNYQGVARPKAAERPGRAETSAAAAPVAAAPARSVADEDAVNNIARVTEITHNIFRQANVKGVLFTTVNEVGRHWNVSRCVAGLCAPGKPPSAALEYCAPNVRKSDVTAVVKLIGLLLNAKPDMTPLVAPDVNEVPELASMRELLASLEIQSLLAVPLVDGDQHAGILLLQQCGATRAWRNTDVVVLKTIADQAVHALQNARLRSLVKTLAVTDEKSGLLKRASYLDVLLSEVRRAGQQKTPCTVALLNFGKPSALLKEAGEKATESVMQQAGQIMCSHLRQADIAVRYDLTSIAVILADTNERNAFFVVDKMRRVISAIKSPGTDHALPVTAGIAEVAIHPEYDSVDIVTEVINRAEAALAIAVSEGGNTAQALAPATESAAIA